MRSHGDVVCMVVDVHVRYGQPEGIFDGCIQSDTIVCTRQIFTVDKHTGQVPIVFDYGSEVSAPTVRQTHQRKSREVERDQFDPVSANESPTRLVDDFIFHDSGERGAAPGKDGFVENSPYKASDLMAIIASDLAGGICQTLGKL